MMLSFQEKSAWGLLIGLIAVSVFYFPRAVQIVEYSASPAALIGISIAGVLILVIFEAIYHAVIAGTGDAQRDERDVLIDLKAERIAGLALGAALVTLVGYVIATNAKLAGAGPHPLLIAVGIIAALTLSEIVKLISQLWFYRTGS